MKTLFTRILLHNDRFLGTTGSNNERCMPISEPEFLSIQSSTKIKDNNFLFVHEPSTIVTQTLFQQVTLHGSIKFYLHIVELNIMYAKDPIFTMHLSPPIQWTYHGEEAHDNPMTELKGIEDITKDIKIET
ncbi:unnamed protein product [Brugia pahangi]|uniref:Uncharacterized protein n=1 Tax=Brugia pahangi TaxID=6280 RepID=A0A0N4TMF6_BRUPA|nr:unnamed protein product [Brugia pahangi]